MVQDGVLKLLLNAVGAWACEAVKELHLAVAAFELLNGDGDLTVALGLPSAQLHRKSLLVSLRSLGLVQVICAISRAFETVVVVNQEF